MVWSLFEKAVLSKVGILMVVLCHSQLSTAQDCGPRLKSGEGTRIEHVETIRGWLVSASYSNRTIHITIADLEGNQKSVSCQIGNFNPHGMDASDRKSSDICASKYVNRGVKLWHCRAKNARTDWFTVIDLELTGGSRRPPEPDRIAGQRSEEQYERVDDICDLINPARVMFEDRKFEAVVQSLSIVTPEKCINANCFSYETANYFEIYAKSLQRIERYQDALLIWRKAEEYYHCPGGTKNWSCETSAAGIKVCLDAIARAEDKEEPQDGFRPFDREYLSASTREVELTLAFRGEEYELKGDESLSLPNDVKSLALSLMSGYGFQTVTIFVPVGEVSISGGEKVRVLLDEFTGSSVQKMYVAVRSGATLGDWTLKLTGAGRRASGGWHQWVEDARKMPHADRLTFSPSIQGLAWGYSEDGIYPADHIALWVAYGGPSIDNTGFGIYVIVAK